MMLRDFVFGRGLGRMEKIGEHTFAILESGKPCGTLTTGLENPAVQEDRKKESRLAAVHYKEISNGGVLVLKLVNFFTLNEIEKKYGAEVGIAYFGKTEDRPEVMYLHPDRDRIIRRIDGNSIMEVGRVYKTEEFTLRLAFMRRCGARLAKCIRDGREGNLDIQVAVI